MKPDLDSLVLNVRKLHEAAAAEGVSTFNDLLGEISTALGDIVSILESRPEKVEVKVPEAKAQPAPQVAVNVAPTPIENHAHAGETVVHVHDRPAAKGWLIEFTFNGTSATVPAGAKLTRIE